MIRTQLRNPQFFQHFIVVIFNITSADFVLISADVCIIENDHNFERTEDCATMFLK